MSGTLPDPVSPKSEASSSEDLVPVPPSPPLPVAPAYAATATGAAFSDGAPARGMYTAAAVINWVTLGIIIVGTLGIGVIAAAWFVPMTIYIHKGAKGPYKHTALGVCTLLFCNFISGILMLVDDSGRPERPVAQRH